MLQALKMDVLTEVWQVRQGVEQARYKKRTEKGGDCATSEGSCPSQGAGCSLRLNVAARTSDLSRGARHQGLYKLLNVCNKFN